MGATLITPWLQTQTTSWGLCLCLQTRQSLPCLLHLEASVSVSLSPYSHYMYIQSWCVLWLYRHPVSPSDETTDDPEFPVVVVAAVAGTAMVLLVAVFCVGLICCRRKRRGEFTWGLHMALSRSCGYLSCRVCVYAVLTHRGKAPPTALSVVAPYAYLVAVETSSPTL